jgi:hypothetical protein
MAMKFSNAELSKLDLDIEIPVEKTNLPVKVTPETKDRFRDLIQKGFTGEQLIKLCCDVVEFKINQRDAEIKNGTMKRNLRILQKA